ncbi:MarR family transcriptional regulator [Brevibacillus choshinensis]|uniref:MarR family transcriptional regulator n=1 Tax=Brevibacillus choshinensis TaxID=54911 RepID=A0ABX7FUK3_BRECH|nr:MarR family transcriptional regulator [Brevibacillus choshinensis]QRG68665.1 MarR family transcriptional regulator [Brevibacillus choshinensis]
MSSDNRQHLDGDLTPLQQELLLELRKNSARAVMLHQTISEKLALNATDHKCLDFLMNSGPVTAGRLAELTGLTTGAVTNVIDRLENAGYIVREKDPSDRRKVVVKPVVSQVNSMNPLFDSLMRRTLQIMSQYDERETGVILNFLRECNDMTLEEMNKLKEDRE